MNRPFGQACLAEDSDSECGRRLGPDEEAKPDDIRDMLRSRVLLRGKRCPARTHEKGNRSRTDPRSCKLALSEDDVLVTFALCVPFFSSSKSIALVLRRGSDRMVKQVRILVQTLLHLIPHYRIDSVNKLNRDCRLIENADAQTHILADTKNKFFVRFSTILLRSLEISECLRQISKSQKIASGKLSRQCTLGFYPSIPAPRYDRKTDWRFPARKCLSTQRSMGFEIGQSSHECSNA